MVYVITFLFIVLDFITGLLKAFKEKNFTSSIMREGLVHKSGSLILIVLGSLIDLAQGYVNLDFTVPMALSFCTYIILMEMFSIVENLGKINPNLVGENIKKYFKKLQ